MPAKRRGSMVLVVYTDLGFAVSERRILVAGTRMPVDIIQPPRVILRLVAQRKTGPLIPLDDITDVAPCSGTGYIRKRDIVPHDAIVLAAVLSSPHAHVVCIFDFMWIRPVIFISRIDHDAVFTYFILWSPRDEVITLSGGVDRLYLVCRPVMSNPDRVPQFVGYCGVKLVRDLPAAADCHGMKAVCSCGDLCRICVLGRAQRRTAGVTRYLDDAKGMLLETQVRSTARIEIHHPLASIELLGLQPVMYIESHQSCKELNSRYEVSQLRINKEIFSFGIPIDVPAVLMEAPIFLIQRKPVSDVSVADWNFLAVIEILQTGNTVIRLPLVRDFRAVASLWDRHLLDRRLALKPTLDLFTEGHERGDLEIGVRTPVVGVDQDNHLDPAVRFQGEFVRTPELAVQQGYIRKMHIGIGFRGGCVRIVAGNPRFVRHVDKLESERIRRPACSTPVLLHELYPDRDHITDFIFLLPSLRHPIIVVIRSDLQPCGRPGESKIPRVVVGRNNLWGIRSRNMAAGVCRTGITDKSSGQLAKHVAALSTACEGNQRFLGVTQFRETCATVVTAGLSNVEFSRVAGVGRYVEFEHAGDGAIADRSRCSPDDMSGQFYKYPAQSFQRVSPMQLTFIKISQKVIFLGFSISRGYGSRKLAQAATCLQLG